MILLSENSLQSAGYFIFKEFSELSLERWEEKLNPITFKYKGKLYLINQIVLGNRVTFPVRATWVNIKRKWTIS